MNFEDDVGMDDLFNGMGGIGGMYGDTDFFDTSSPVHDPLQENGGLDDLFGQADSSLTVPIREQHYGTLEPPELSPAMPQYQTMQTYDGHNMSLENQINSQGYNSFEQPVQMINGDYTQPVEEPPMHRVETPQQHYYANERPSTSTSHQQKPVVYQTPTPNSRPSSTHVRSQPAPARQRPIQPKGSNSSRKKAPEPAQNGGSQVVLQLSQTDNQRIGEIVAQIQVLKAQQNEYKTDNGQAIAELEASLLSIFNKDGSLGKIGADVQPPPQPPPSNHRPSRPSQNHGHQQQQQPRGYEAQPSSPYQPQMLVVSQPSTSQGHVYQEYHQAPPQHVVVHQNQIQTHHQQPQKQHQLPQQQHPPRQQQQQQPLYRVATVPQSSMQQIQVSGSYQQQSQAVYVQPPLHLNQGPTVGQVIRQQQQLQQVRIVKIQAPVVPPQPVSQAMPPQQHIPQAPILTPQPPVFQAPPRQTAAQVERQLEEKKAVRRKRIHDFMSNMDEQLEDAGTNRPFSDLGDVLKRLLPYHRYHERDLQQEHIDFLDANLLRANLNNNERLKYLKGRVHQLFLEESARDAIKEEQNLLLYLDMEYEKRKLEEEKGQVNEFNREEFVRHSPLLPALRGSTVTHPTPLPHPPKFVNHYEYTPFAEVARPVSPCKSPYIMSPSSSTRSHSPVKSPTFQQPRLRVRSTNSTSSHEPSTSVGSPEKERRKKEERNGRIGMDPARKTRNLVPEKKAPVEAVRVKPETVSPRKAEIPAKKARESPTKKTQDVKPILKEIKREPVEAAAETSTATAEVVVTKTKSPTKAASKTVKIKVKEEVVEAEPLVPNCSDAAAAVQLPAKKVFLSRVRNAIPPALRSPPAQMAKPSTNGVESDGSCSPELGLEDFSSVPSTPVDPAAPSISKALDARSSLPSPLKKLVPLPAPVPKKTNSVKKSKHTVDVAPPPENKIRCKLGPPPPPSTPIVKETRSTRNSAGSEARNEFVTPRRPKRHEEQANLADVDTPATEVRRPPAIKLKLKIGGQVLTVDGDEVARQRNEHLMKAQAKEAKRLRKEAKRKKREEHERKREERLRVKEEAEAGTSSPRGDVTVTPTEGLKLKFKFSKPRSRTVTPAIPAEPENLPSTSRANGVGPNHQPSDRPPPVIGQIKKLRIRVGPQEPMIEMAVAPVTRATNGGAVASMPIPSAAAGSAQGALPAVNFSDQSDSDGERLRSAADETLRTWGGIGLNATPTQPPLLPFSSHP